MDDDIIDLRIERVLENEFSSNSSTDGHGESSDEESSSVSRRPEVNVSYDLSLPATHSYLGTDLEELSGRTVLDDNSCQSMPILTLPNVIVIPGQILPLQLYNPATISMMRNIMKNDRTFGVINSRNYGGGYARNIIEPIGTTVEVRSFHEEPGDGVMMLKLKAEGRQRFRILETRSQVDGILVGKVRILPESSLQNPGVVAKLTSLEKFQIPPPRYNPYPKPCPSSFLPRPSHKYNRFDFANYTPFPAFVYKQYDHKILMQKIVSELQNWSKFVSIENLTSNSKEFSFWVTANLPIDDKQRMHLLSMNEVTQRLRHVLKILESCSALCCRNCFNVIAKREDIFSMSQHGPQGTYVNPNGYVHEAITMYKTQGLLLSGRASTEQSWFPGYAWTIADCGNCLSHIGWLFTAVDKKLKPHKFWALCRSAIQPRLVDAEDSEEEP